MTSLVIGFDQVYKTRLVFHSMEQALDLIMSVTPWTFVPLLQLCVYCAWQFCVVAGKIHSWVRLLMPSLSACISVSSTMNGSQHEDASKSDSMWFLSVYSKTLDVFINGIFLYHFGRQSRAMTMAYSVWEPLEVLWQTIHKAASYLEPWDLDFKIRLMWNSVKAPFPSF